MSSYMDSIETGPSTETFTAKASNDSLDEKDRATEVRTISDNNKQKPS